MTTRLAAWIAVVLLVVAVGFGRSVWRERLRKQRAEHYSALIGECDAKVRAGQFVEGLTAAQEAVSLNSDDYAGHYYLAYALYKQGLLGSATEHVAEAMRLVGDSDRGGVQKLSSAIDASAAAATHVARAERALADGIPVLAAREYGEAWAANSLGWDLGLKGAKLLHERGDYLEESKLLHRMLARTPDDKVRSEIESALAVIRGDVYREFASLAVGGWRALGVGGAQVDDARAKFVEAIDLMPLCSQESNVLFHERSPYVGLALCHASTGDSEAAVRILASGVKLGLTIDASTFQDARWMAVRDDPRFVEFIANAFGSRASQYLKSGRE